MRTDWMGRLVANPADRCGGLLDCGTGEVGPAEMGRSGVCWRQCGWQFRNRVKWDKTMSSRDPVLLIAATSGPFVL